jgi:uncharacterized membrane protein YhhN
MRNPIIYVVLVLLAMLAIPFKPFDGYFFIKALPVVFLGLWAWRGFMGNARWWLCAALGLSALGDVLLAFNFKFHFMLGLAAFLLAQLAYGVIYYRQCENARRWRMALAAVLPLAVLVLLVPQAGDMTVAVGCYTLAIGVMLVSAWGHKAPSLLIALGASSFIVSDALIGLNKFVMPFPGEAYWVMATYYLAQGLMFEGLRRYWRAS